LKKGSQDAVNTKYLELENKLFQVERDNKSLVSQVELEKVKNKKLAVDFEQMVNLVKDAENKKKA
jgi:hypothetical protein